MWLNNATIYWREKYQFLLPEVNNNTFIDVGLQCKYWACWIYSNFDINVHAAHIPPELSLSQRPRRLAIGIR